MRDFGVIFERAPLMCDNNSVISVAKNLVFHKRMRYLERRHILRDHVENGGIEMRCIDTERQVANIFTKPLMLQNLLICEEKLVFAIIISWFEEELVFYLIYLYILFFSCIFFILT
jgi:hypothetical protein